MPLTHAPKPYLVGTCTEAHDDPRHPTSHRPPNDLLLLPASSCLYVSLWVLGIVCSSGTDLDSGTELDSGTVLVSRVLTSVGHHPGSGHRQRLGHRPRLGHALSSITMQRRTTSASGTPSCLVHAARLGPRPRPGHRHPLGHRPRLGHRQLASAIGFNSAIVLASGARRGWLRQGVRVYRLNPKSISVDLHLISP